MFDMGASDAAKRASDVIDLSYVSTSDTAQNVYTLVDTDFALRDRSDSAEVIVDGVKLYETRIKDGKKYKMIEVDLDAFDDDKVGQYNGVFYRLGQAQALGPSRLMEDTILASEVAAPGGNYDGVPLISTAHPVKPFEGGSATWANKLVISAGLNINTFAQAYAAFQAFPGEDGRPLNNTPTVLMVDPGYRQIANDICFSDRPQGGQGGGNAWQGLVRPMFVPQLATADGWYLADDSSTLERPWIFQERRALRMIPLFSSHEDPAVLKSRKLGWLVDGRIGAGYGYANRVLKVTKT
jgi:phage major head subunit gpT-like protein